MSREYMFHDQLLFCHELSHLTVALLARGNSVVSAQTGGSKKLKLPELVQLLSIRDKNPQKTSLPELTEHLNPKVGNVSEIFNIFFFD